MTAEDKKLLLQELCCRMPFGLKVEFIETEFHTKKMGDLLNVDFGGETIISYYDTEGILEHLVQKIERYCILENIKPFLRPIKSMTEIEEYEYHQMRNTDSINLLEAMGCKEHIAHLITPILVFTKSFDWLNTHHFDYRGLIEKGFALEAPKGMYK